MRTMTAEETRGGTLLGHAILLLAVAMIVVVMGLATAAPVFATGRLCESGYRVAERLPDGSFVCIPTGTHVVK